MRLRPLGLATLLVLLTLAAYLPALSCGFVWDDDDYVTENPVLRTFAGIARIWFEPTSLPQYYPLVHTTFWLEYRLWGQSPLGYHLVNVLLHATSAVLFWRLLQRLLLPGALLAAALFAVHPVHVESVAWVTERKNVLSLACYLVAAHQWLRWRDEGGGARAYGLASAAFLGALLSKTVTCSLPAALLLVVWWRDGRASRRDLASLLPWFAAGALSAAATVVLEATHVRASGQPWSLSGWQRPLVAGRAVFFYLGKLLLPLGLCFCYGRWRLDAGGPGPWLWPLLAVAVAGAAFALRRRARAPLCVLLLFGGTLLPALGFFDVYPFRYSFVADHFQYHASLAPLAAVAAAATQLARALRPAWHLLLAGAAVAGLAAATLRQLPVYRDRLTLWTATLRCNPDSVVAHADLGRELLARGDRAGARAHFERAIALEPGSYEARTNYAVLLVQDGDLDAARAQLEQALADFPAFAPAHNNLAYVLAVQGHEEEALAHVERALAANPDYYEAHAVLGMVEHRLRRWERARAACLWILQRTPEIERSRETRLRLLDCELGLGRADAALQHGLLLARALPADAEVRAALVRALVVCTQDLEPGPAAARARAALANLGDGADAVLRALADQFVQDGRDAHAAALRGH